MSWSPCPSPAELVTLLAACPVDLAIADERGVTRDGDPINFGPAAHGVLPGGDRISARITREPAGLRIAWRFIAARAGVEFKISAPPYSRIARWLHRRQIAGGHHLHGPPAVRAALADLLSTSPVEGVLLHADLVCVRDRPGANLLAFFRVPEAPGAVATSHRFAHALYQRFLPPA